MKLFLSIVIALSLLLSISSVTAASLGDGLIMCYSADEASAYTNTVEGATNLTSPGTPTTRTGKVGANSYNAPAADNTNYWYAPDGNEIGLGESNKTLVFWYNLDTTAGSSNQFMFGLGSAAAGSMFGAYTGISGEGSLVKFSSGSADSASTTGTSTGTWYQMALIYSAEDDTTYIYRDGVNILNDTHSISLSTSALLFGQYPAAASFGEFDGAIDEFMVFDVQLSTSDLSTLHNGSTGVSCDYVNALKSTNTTTNLITVELTNNVTGGSLGSFTFTNVTGSLTFNYFNITSSGFCVTYTGNGTGTNCTTSGSGESTFFNVTVEETFTGDITIQNSTYQNLINLSLYQVHTNASVNNFNATNSQVTNTTTTGTILLKALNGSNNIQADIAGNYSINLTCTPETPLTTLQCGYTGVYDTIYTFNATNAWTGGQLLNFNLVVSNLSLGGEIFNGSTTTGNVTLQLLQGYTYYIEFSQTSYQDLNVSLAANASSQYYQFDSLPAPSIDITILDADDGNLLTENVTIQLINNQTGQTNYTTTGGFFSGNLTPGLYTIKLESANYSQSVYIVTVSEGSVYYLTAYLQYAPFTMIQQYVDSISLLTMEGVTVSQEKIVNGSWQVLNSKSTDITGRTSFRYAEDTAYRFTAVQTGYTSKQFELDPVLFETYTIKLTKLLAIDFEQDFGDVLIQYTPHTFYGEQENNVNLSFVSPTGLFQEYTYNITYPGGSVAGSGTNTAGESFQTSFNMSGANITSLVYVHLTYDTSLGDQRNFTYVHSVLMEPGNTTFIANSDNTYGLGLIERLLIGTVLLVVITGFFALAVGGLSGLVLGLFIMGMLIYIGFWPWWAVSTSLLVGLALILGRST